MTVWPSAMKLTMVTLGCKSQCLTRPDLITGGCEDNNGGGENNIIIVTERSMKKEGLLIDIVPDCIETNCRSHDQLLLKLHLVVCSVHPVISTLYFLVCLLLKVNASLKK